MNTIIFILILIVLISVTALYLLSRRKNIEDETGAVAKGYRVTFFKNGEKVDSKIVR